MKSRSVRYSLISRKHIPIVSGMLMLVSFISCNTVKKVHKDEYLLNNNKVIYRFGSTQKNNGLNTITNIGKEGIEQFQIPRSIAPSEVLPYVKQKPNTRILFVIPLYLYIYDLPDSAKTALKKDQKDSAYKIEAQKKGWSDTKLKRKIDRKTGREWIMSQGEAPVILDTSLAQKSTEQIKTFLMNKGFYDAQVKDSIHYQGRKADVSYIIKPGKPYRVNQIEYYFEDLSLAAEINSDTVDCMIRRKEIYDKDVLDAESDRLTKQLNNAGFYYFSKQYVSYVLDTNKTTHQVNILINIKRYAKRDINNKDSIIETSHPWYRIRHVTVQMSFDPTKAAFYHATDTVVYDGLTIVYPHGQLFMKPNKFRQKIFVTPGDVYRIVNREDTYTGLSQLNEFRYISLKYTPVQDSNYVDCTIQLMPVVKLSYGAEFEVTNTGGDGGIQGDISYQNHNQFKGAEQLTFKLNGGLIAQQVLAGNQNVNKYIPLNTVDLGPELDFTVPRRLFPSTLPFFPFMRRNNKRRENPQTTFKLSFNYQLRLNYYQTHVLGFSYAFNHDPSKYQHITIAWLELNLVNANLTPFFQEELDNYNLFFRNSFTNQFITDTRFSYSVNNQNLTSVRQNHFFLFKLNLEVSGLDFYALQRTVLPLPVDGSGSYYVPGLAPYSQYGKADAEYRHYWIRGKKQKIVFRGLAGFGLPYANSTEMPFIKSFWAGGSNDIRAWQVQTLGPGGSASSDVVGQIGEVKMESNLEYRVSLIKYLGLGFFVDAGNIWLLPSQANNQIPLATIQFTGPNPFYSEIAVGTGVGLRFDFTYFVARFDVGLPLRDPALPAGERIVSFSDELQRRVLNFGIGYPF